MTILAVNIDNQAVRIRNQKGVVLRKVGNLEHHPRAARLELCDSDLLQESVIYVKALAYQRGSQLGVAQIENNTVGMGNSLGAKLDLAFEVDGDARVVRGRPVADSGYARQLRRRRIYGSLLRLSCAGSNLCCERFFGRFLVNRALIFSGAGFFAATSICGLLAFSLASSGFLLAALVLAGFGLRAPGRRLRMLQIGNGLLGVR